MVRTEEHFAPKKSALNKKERLKEIAQEQRLGQAQEVKTELKVHGKADSESSESEDDKEEAEGHNLNIDKMVEQLAKEVGLGGMTEKPNVQSLQSSQKTTDDIEKNNLSGGLRPDNKELAEPILEASRDITKNTVDPEEIVAIFV